VKGKQRLIPYLMAASLLFSGIPAGAAEFSASFKGTDIQEFIEIVGRNLEKTIIVDPSVRGTINVRSYDTLTDEQYYQFFFTVNDPRFGTCPVFGRF